MIEELRYEQIKAVEEINFKKFRTIQKIRK